MNDASIPTVAPAIAFKTDFVGSTNVGTIPAIPVIKAVFHARPQSTEKASPELLRLYVTACTEMSARNPPAAATPNVATIDVVASAPAVIVAGAISATNCGTKTVAVAAINPVIAPSIVASRIFPPVQAAVNAPADAPITVDNPMNTQSSIIK